MRQALLPVDAAGDPGGVEAFPARWCGAASVSGAWGVAFDVAAEGRGGVKRRVGEHRKAAKGRAWRCLLCPEKGVEADEKATTAAFERHYMAKHVERKS